MFWSEVSQSTSHEKSNAGNRLPQEQQQPKRGENPSRSSSPSSGSYYTQGINESIKKKEKRINIYIIYIYIYMFKDFLNIYDFAYKTNVFIFVYILGKVLRNPGNLKNLRFRRIY